MESQLEISSIWEDDDLLEIRVSASNGRFSGAADCYTTREEIAKLVERVSGFPQKIDQEVRFTTGEGEQSSFFTLVFTCNDASGHIILRIKIVHIESYSSAPQEKYFSEFDIPVEASAIDTFAKSLDSLSKSKIGEVKAVLPGKT